VAVEGRVRVESDYDEELQRLANSEILLARGHRDGRNNWYRSSHGLILFRLMVHPLQPGAVSPCPVQGA
jgi:hypothetical protein